MSFTCCPPTSDLPERWVFQAGDVQATVVPSAGMNLVSLEVGDVPFIDTPRPLGEFMAHVRTGGIPLLHPWANRLRGDLYRFGDVDVDLSGVSGLKRDDHGLPIHGLVLRSTDFDVELDGDGALVGSLAWRPGVWGFEAFPFEHVLRVRWSLTTTVSGVRVECTMTVEAGAGAVPIGAGWHPYLSPGGIDAESPLEVHSPPLERIELDELGLPVRKEGAFTVLGEATFDGPLGATAYDDLYRAPAGGWDVLVKRDDAQLRIAADDQWPMLQVYAPVGAGYVCVEPMLAATAALSDGDARVVQGGKTFSATFSLHAESIER